MMIAQSGGQIARPIAASRARVSGFLTFLEMCTQVSPGISTSARPVRLMRVLTRSPLLCVVYLATP